MADTGLSDVTVDKLIQRLSSAVQNNDEKTRDEIDEVLKLEDQLNIGDRETFQKAKRIQCLEAIRLQSLSLLQLLFSKDHVFVEDKLDFKTNQEFMSCAIRSDFLAGLKYLVDNGLKLESEPDEQEWVALFHAVEYGKPQIVDFLLKEQPNHVHSTLGDMTLVGLACLTRNIDVLRLLFNSAITFDPSQICGAYCGSVPLQFCFEEQFENDSNLDLFNCVKILVENGADVNTKDSTDDQTPLIMAARHNLQDVMTYLIENGADLTSFDRRKNTALHYLCHYSETEDSLDCIQRFVKQIKIDNCLHILDSKNSADETPLHIAVCFDKSQVVDILVEAGCDVNGKCPNGDPILIDAISRRASLCPTSGIVAKLITGGSNLQTLDKYGKTPLLMAAFLKDLDSIKLLIQHGADLNSIDFKGKSFFDFCFRYTDPVTYYKTSDIEVLEYLITVGARFRIEDISEESLERILDQDDAETLEYLISNGLDIHHIGKNNRNILHLLSSENKCTGIWVNKTKPYCDEADVNKQDTNGDTPLMYVANKELYYCCPVPINYLLERGANVYLRNKKGQTSIMIVATKNDKKILPLLIEAGTDVNIRAQDGRTALQFLKPYTDRKNFDQCYLDCLILLLKNGGSPSLDYKDLKGFTPFQYVLETKRVSFMWYLITQNCSFSSVSDRGETFKFLHKYRDCLLKLAKIFYHSGAPKQLILDIFKMDDGDKNKFKSFCENLSLTELCRRQIRVSIGPGIQEKLENLNIAPKLFRFVCLMDLIPLRRFDINNISNINYQFDSEDDDDNDDGNDDDDDDYDDDNDGDDE